MSSTNRARPRGALVLLALGLALALLTACSSSTTKHATAPATTMLPVVPADCTPARPAPPVQASYNFDFHGHPRTYALKLPADYDGAHALPMIFLFHGFASSKEAIDADTALPEKGAARGFVVVTPDGSSNPRTWNFISGASGSAADDYGFIASLVRDLSRRLCIDTHRVYATGHSAGSAFVGFLICHPPYSFAGAAMVEATIPSSCPPSRVQAVLSIHGTADTTVLYNGGLGVGQTVPIPPVKQTVASLAQRALCAPDPVTEHPAPGVVRLRYTGCAPGENVALLTIEGGGHPWAGGLQATHTPPVVPGARFSATKAILDFFATSAAP